MIRHRKQMFDEINPENKFSTSLKKTRLLQIWFARRYLVSKRVMDFVEKGLHEIGLMILIKCYHSLLSL